jgi:fucose 4-O-acetylase-like acetyltransferase
MSATLHPRPVKTTAPTTTPPRPTRDPWFDNAKMLLVTLVVLGHGWTLLPHHRLDTWLYDFLYLWHVPAFVMVTGYLSRSFTWSRRDLSRLLTTVALPYLVFEAALGAFRVYVGGEDLDMLFADPHWPMWYLAVLFAWRLLTPALKAVPAALPVAVAGCLLGGLATSELLDTSRVLGLLPFFVLGLLAGPEQVERLRRRDLRVPAAVTLTLGLVLSYLIEGRMATEWLYWRSGYAELGVTAPEGMAVRVGLLVAGGMLALSFLALVPRRAGWFAGMGAATLVVYLFHGFVVKGVEYTDFPGWASANPVLALALVSPLSVVLALLLAWEPVATRLNVVVDPVGSWRRSRQHSRPAGG